MAAFNIKMEKEDTSQSIDNATTSQSIDNGDIALSTSNVLKRSYKDTENFKTKCIKMEPLNAIDGLITPLVSSLDSTETAVVPYMTAEQTKLYRDFGGTPIIFPNELKVFGSEHILLTEQLQYIYLDEQPFCVSSMNYLSEQTLFFVMFTNEKFESVYEDNTCILSNLAIRLTACQTNLEGAKLDHFTELVDFFKTNLISYNELKFVDSSSSTLYIVDIKFKWLKSLFNKINSFENIKWSFHHNLYTYFCNSIRYTYMDQHVSIKNNLKNINKTDQFATEEIKKINLTHEFLGYTASPVWVKAKLKLPVPYYYNNIKTMVTSCHGNFRFANILRRTSHTTNKGVNMKYVFKFDYNISPDSFLAECKSIVAMSDTTVYRKIQKYTVVPDQPKPCYIIYNSNTMNIPPLSDDEKNSSMDIFFNISSESGFDIPDYVNIPTIIQKMLADYEISQFSTNPDRKDTKYKIKNKILFLDYINWVYNNFVITTKEDNNYNTVTYEPTLDVSTHSIEEIAQQILDKKDANCVERFLSGDFTYYIWSEILKKCSFCMIRSSFHQLSYVAGYMNAQNEKENLLVLKNMCHDIHIFGNKLALQD